MLISMCVEILMDGTTNRVKVDDNMLTIETEQSKCVIFHFTNKNSIDTVIEALNVMKKNL